MRLTCTFIQQWVSEWIAELKNNDHFLFFFFLFFWLLTVFVVLKCKYLFKENKAFECRFYLIEERVVTNWFSKLASLKNTKHLLKFSLWQIFTNFLNSSFSVTFENHQQQKLKSLLVFNLNLKDQVLRHMPMIFYFPK